LKYFLAILLLAVSVMADTEITSLPYTCSTPGETYYLTQNLTADYRAITISAANITLDGDSNTIYFNCADSVGVDRGSGVWGIFLSDVNGCLIQDLILIEDNVDDTLGEWATGIRIGGNGGFTLQDCDVHCRSDNSIEVYGEGAEMNLIDGGNYTSYVRGYDNRMTFTANCIRLTDQAGAYQNTTQDYNYKITGVTIDSCPHTGIEVHGKSEVSYCNVTVDARNDKYTYPSDADTKSSTNAYALMQSAGTGTVRFHHNTVRSGNNHFGGRGIAFGELAPIATSNGIFECDHNDVNIHRGIGQYGTEGWGQAGYGIRTRSEGSSLDSLFIHDNTVYVEVRDSTYAAVADSGYDSSYSKSGSGMVIAVHGTALRIWNNDVKVYVNPNWHGNNSGYHYALQIYYGGGIYAGSDDGMSYDNKYWSNGTAICLGGDNGGVTWGSGDSMTFLRDNICWGAPDTSIFTDHWDQAAAVIWGYSTQPAVNDIIFQDVIWTYSDSFDLSECSESAYIYEYRSLLDTVFDSTGYVSNGANYWVVNGLDSTVASGTTGADGLIEDSVCYYLHYWTGSEYSDTAYNPFIITATKDNDTIADTLDIYSGTAVEGDSVTATLTFTALSPSPSYNQISGTFFQGLEIRK